MAYEFSTNVGPKITAQKTGPVTALAVDTRFTPFPVKS